MIGIGVDTDVEGGAEDFVLNTRAEVWNQFYGPGKVFGTINPSFEDLLADYSAYVALPVDQRSRHAHHDSSANSYGRDILQMHEESSVTFQKTLKVRDVEETFHKENFRVLRKLRIQDDNF